SVYGLTKASELHDATPYTEVGRTFDAVFALVLHGYRNRILARESSDCVATTGTPRMSFAPDSLYEPLADGLHALAAIRQIDGGWRVVTHCMYPSNGLVEITVRGGVRNIVASDEGGALGEALSAGIPIRDYRGAVAHIVREQG